MGKMFFSVFFQTQKHVFFSVFSGAVLFFPSRLVVEQSSSQTMSMYADCHMPLDVYTPITNCNCIEKQMTDVLRSTFD